MSIRSSSATFVRFFVPDTIKENFWGYVEEKLRDGGFQESEEPREQSAGFSAWEDLFDSAFLENTYQKGEYIAFQLRLDQRTVPSIVRKQYIRRHVQSYREKNNGRWPSRQERIEIQEAVESWLLQRTLPKPTGCEVVWNPTAQWLLLGVTSTKLIEVFLDHFEKHFRLYPIPLYHAQWAMHLLSLSEAQKDTLLSMVPVRSPQAMYDGRFLGYEFLTWLWHFMDESGGAIELTDGRRAELNLGERLVLTLPADGKERVICTTQANSVHEARTGLQQGKMVEEIQICAKVQENDYTFTLDSFLWAIKGLKTPKQLPDAEDEDPDGKFLEKMYFLEEVFATLNAVFNRFLASRLCAEWETHSLPRLKEWIKSKPSAADSDALIPDEERRAPF